LELFFELLSFALVALERLNHLIVVFVVDLVAAEHCVPYAEEGRVISNIVGVVEIVVGGRGRKGHQAVRRP